MHARVSLHGGHVNFPGQTLPLAASASAQCRRLRRRRRRRIRISCDIHTHCRRVNRCARWQAAKRIKCVDVAIGYVSPVRYRLPWRIDGGYIDSRHLRCIKHMPRKVTTSATPQKRIIMLHCRNSSRSATHTHTCTFHVCNFLKRQVR